MPSSQTLQLKVSQHLQLAPQVRYALKLLQFNQAQLTEHLKEAVLGNPLIELEAPRPMSEPQPSWVLPNHHSDYDPLGVDQWAQDPKSSDLKAHLIWQANLAGFEPDDYSLALLIIDCIDESGLLGLSLAEIAENARKILGEYSDHTERTQSVLKRIKTFEPIGVGSESLQESLLTQLEGRFSKNHHFQLAKQLLTDHFQSLGRKGIDEISALVRHPAGDLKDALSLIRQLNPHPASSFGDLQGHDIAPDVYIHLKPQCDSPVWIATINHSRVPSVTFNNSYDELIPLASGTDKAYLTKQRREAKTLIEGLAMRQQTIVRVAEYLANHQNEYLLYGKKCLVPLTQKMVANELGINVSTVSRTLKDKYAQTPLGLIPLKQFLSGRLGHKHKGSVGAQAIHADISDLIAAEDRAKPLSDQRIATLLGDKGVKIARRTVTKYRENLGIADSKRRKSLYSWQD